MEISERLLQKKELNRIVWGAATGQKKSGDTGVTVVQQADLW